jgi:hypothetical protein
MNYEQDIRIVLWTGKKFLFMGSDKDGDFIDRETLPVVGLYDTMDSSDKWTKFIPILPVSCTTSNALDGTGSASLTFVTNASPKMLYLRSDRKTNRFDATGFTDPAYKTFLDNSKDYYKKFHERFIKPNVKLLQRVGVYDEVFSLDPNSMMMKSEQISLFNPPQMIWIMMRNQNLDDQWYRVFTGVVNDVTVREQPGKSYTISVKASNMIDCLSRVPMITKRVAALGKDLLLQTYSGDINDADVQAFLKVYLAFAFTDANMKTFDASSELKYFQILARIAKLTNRCFGLIEDSELNEMKASLTNAESNLAGYEVTETDITGYQQYCKKNHYYNWKFVEDDEKKIGLDYGKGPLSDPRLYKEKIGVSDLFFKNTLSPKEGFLAEIGGLKVGNVLFNDDIRYLDEVFGNQITVFQKLYLPAIKMIEQPEYAMCSNFIRRFCSAFKFYFHSDACGNWVTEYPKWDALPKFQVVGGGKISNDRVKDDYDDHDEKYILDTTHQITSLSVKTSPSQLRNHVQMPFNYNIPGGNIPGWIANKYATPRYLDTLSVMLLGMNDYSMERMFVDLGNMTAGSPTDPSVDFLKKVLSLYYHTINEDVYTLSADTKLRPFMQIGRNVIIVHRERCAMLKSVSHNFDTGRGATTSLELVMERPLTSRIENPWRYFKDNNLKVEVSDGTVTADDVANIPDGADVAILPFPFTEKQYDAWKRITGLIGLNERLGITYPTYENATWLMDGSSPFVTEGCQGDIGKVNAALISDLIAIRDRIQMFMLTNVTDIDISSQNNFKFLITSTFRAGSKGRHGSNSAVDVSGVIVKHKSDGMWYTYRVCAGVISHGEIVENTGSLNHLLGDEIASALSARGYHLITNGNHQQGPAPGAERNFERCMIWDVYPFIYSADSNELTNGSAHLDHVHVSVAEGTVAIPPTKEEIERDQKSKYGNALFGGSRVGVVLNMGEGVK